jgi:hypothetical protein
MRNTTPSAPASPTPSARPNQARHRPAKGVGVPATLWLPPAGSGSETPHGYGAVLPSWALRHLVAQYAKPGQTVLTADTRAVHAEHHQFVFHPLRAHHDPHPETRPRSAEPVAHLAVLEIETPPHTTLHTAIPGDPAHLLADVIRTAIRTAADRLAPGAVLAIALPAPAPGPATQQASIVLRLAQDAGFTYQQHIAVLTADLDDDRITPRLTDANIQAVNQARRAGIPATAPVHLDLAIFTLPQEDNRA